MHLWFCVSRNVSKSISKKDLAMLDEGQQTTILGIENRTKRLSLLRIIALSKMAVRHGFEP